MIGMRDAMRRLFRRRGRISALMRARRRVRRCKDSGLPQQSSYQLYCCQTHLNSWQRNTFHVTADRSTSYPQRIRHRAGTQQRCRQPITRMPCMSSPTFPMHRTTGSANPHHRLRGVTIRLWR